jgi:hypothetical protein
MNGGRGGGGSLCMLGTHGGVGGGCGTQPFSLAPDDNSAAVNSRSDDRPGGKGSSCILGTHGGVGAGVGGISRAGPSSGVSFMTLNSIGAIEQRGRTIALAVPQGCHPIATGPVSTGWHGPVRLKRPWPANGFGSGGNSAVPGVLRQTSVSRAWLAA